MAKNSIKSIQFKPLVHQARAVFLHWVVPGIYDINHLFGFAHLGDLTPSTTGTPILALSFGGRVLTPGDRDG